MEPRGLMFSVRSPSPIMAPDNYNHFGATRLVAGLSIISSALSLYTQIWVYPRAFMTLRVAQFSLKIARLSFSMGPRGTRAYGLRPRLWLLVSRGSLLSRVFACSSRLPFLSSPAVFGRARSPKPLWVPTFRKRFEGEDLRKLTIFWTL